MYSTCDHNYVNIYFIQSSSGASTALASCHFIEQLSICLWRSNSHMFLYLFSLLPVSPLWELSPEADSPAHGFSHSEPLGL